MKIPKTKWHTKLGLLAVAFFSAIMIASPGGTVTTPQPHGPAHSDWKLVWHDEFDTPGTALDPNKWDKPAWHVQGVDMDPANSWQYGGRQVLNLSSTTKGGLIRSKFGLLPGMVAEAKIKFPADATGQIVNWPAWWASGPYVNGKAASGEHDIAERIIAGLKVTYWDQNRTKISVTPAGSWGNEYHTFTLYRRASDARVYWDGKLVASYTTNDDGGPEALFLSLGHSDPTLLSNPGRVRTDYVRVWQR